LSCLMSMKDHPFRPNRRRVPKERYAPPPANFAKNGIYAWKSQSEPVLVVEIAAGDATHTG
jgi:hypothetical protein